MKGEGRTGRRPGPSRTRAQILDAARAAFAERGYDAVSVRAVAKRVGVDPALVHRFYGGKDGLFVAAMELPVSPRELVRPLLAAGTEGLGERLVAAILAVHESPASAPLQAMLRSAATSERAAAMLREFVTSEVLGPIAEAASPDRPQLRAALAGSQIVGLVFTRHVIGIEALASAGAAELAAVVGPTVDRYLTAPLPQAGGAG